MYRVNVEGTKNVIALCRAHGARMVYVSSVHALPEKPRGEVVYNRPQAFRFYTLYLKK